MCLSRNTCVVVIMYRRYAYEIINMPLLLYLKTTIYNLHAKKNYHDNLILLGYGRTRNQYAMKPVQMPKLRFRTTSIYSTSLLILGAPFVAQELHGSLHVSLSAALTHGDLCLPPYLVAWVGRRWFQFNECWVPLDHDPDSPSPP